MLEDKHLEELRKSAKESHPCNPYDTLKLIHEIELLRLKEYQNNLRIGMAA